MVMRSPIFRGFQRRGIDVNDPSLVLYLPLADSDMASSSFTSKDLNRYTATVTGATWGQYGRTFDGVDDYITTNAPASLITDAGQFTFIAWVNHNALASGTDIIFDTSTGVGWGFGSGWTADKWQFWLYLDSVWESTPNSTNNVTYGVWHHLVGWYNGSAMKIYDKGVEEATVAKSGTIGATGNFWFGASGPGSTNDFYGSIGELWAYNRALTVTEIQQHYLATKGRYGL